VYVDELRIYVHSKRKSEAGSPKTEVKSFLQKIKIFDS
jgi:hypothetical protein